MKKTNKLVMIVFSLAVVWLFVLALAIPCQAQKKQRIVKILVSTPHIGNKIYRPVSDVMAGSIIRELNRHGGIEIIDRELSEKHLRDQGLEEWINNRDLAIEVGSALGADIVMYSSLGKGGRFFNYSIAYIEVKRDIIQRVVHGFFNDSDTPADIGRIMKFEMSKFTNFIPAPSELDDPGSLIRDNTIDPYELPPVSLMENFPGIGMYGIMEQILTYYRIFPGEIEYIKLEQARQITRLEFREDMDQDLTKLFSKFRIYADFALRHNMQVFLIKDCSIRAVNLLLANKIPVIYSPDGTALSILMGYVNLRQDGYALFLPAGTDPFESYDFTHRRRVGMMIALPKPGRKGGITKQYIEDSIAIYKDEWDKTPRLVEIKEGYLDIITSDIK